MSELIERALAAGVGVGQISDAMDELGIPRNAGGGYRLLGGKGGTVFGRAFTLKQNVLEPGQSGSVRQGEAALTLAAAGDILVIDAAGNADIVTWGEGHSLRAQINGLSGVVLHGVTRDIEAIASGSLPVLCRGTSPVRSKGRLYTAAVNVPVNIDGVDIAPGDLVAIDADGLVCLPKIRVNDILAMACEIQTAEQQRDEALRARIA